MLQWRLAWREMRRHPGRATLTLLSVIIGVAAVVAVGLATGSARRAYHQMYETITGRAALEVIGVGGDALEASWLETVRATPGVAAAVPLIQRPAIMYYKKGGRVKVLALGVDPAADAVVRDFELVEGRALRGDTGVLLDASLARGLHIGVGEHVRLLARRGRSEVAVVGLVQPRSGAAVSGGGVLFMSLGSAQRRFAAPAQVDRIQLVLDDDRAVAAVEAELARRLPDGVLVQPPSTRSHVAEESMLGLENGLRMATGFSLLAAFFIITNTFLMSVGQRRRELAVLRAIGATRGQVAGLLFREALVLAALGTLGGFVAGPLAARLLNHSFSGFFQTELPPIEFRFLPLLVAAVFGLGVSLLSTALPARKAAQFTPLEGMSGVARGDVEGTWRAGVLLGVLLLAVCLVLFVVSLMGWAPIETSVAVTILALVALVLLLPVGLRPLTRLVELAFSPLAPVESRLARRQLLRHRGRTTLTVGVLFVAVSTGVGLAHGIVDNIEDVRRWYRAAFAGDFFVRAAMPDMETGLSACLPDSVGRQLLENVSGIKRLDSFRFVSGKAGKQPVVIIVTGTEFCSDAPDAPAPPPFSAPLGDCVVVGSVLAQRLGLAAGGSITLETRHGPQPLAVSQVRNGYLAAGLTVHMNRALARRLFEVQGADAYVVTADRQKLDQTETELGRFCAKEGILLQSYAELTRLIEGMMAGVVACLWGVLALGLIVAAFGVANTLGMNVLEQTRELGLLRVVAMTRGQVRKAIIAQAAMLGLLAVLPGILAGVGVAYIMSLATLPVLGHPIPFAFYPRLVIGGLVSALVLVLAAAWVPAERAARLCLTEALRYE